MEKIQIKKWIKINWSKNECGCCDNIGYSGGTIHLLTLFIFLS